MSTQHTPGPWAPEVMVMDKPLAEGTPVLAIMASPDDGFLIAHPPFSPRDKANARLIAAAPTMADYIRERAQQGDAAAQQIMEQINGSR